MNDYDIKILTTTSLSTYMKEAKDSNKKSNTLYIYQRFPLS